MFDIDKWNEIFTSLRKNLLRTILSGFTVALGLFIFITLFGLGNGLKNSFMKEFIRGSANAIFIYSDVTTKAYNGLQQGRRIQFKNNDLAFLKTEFGNDFQYITAALYDNAKVSYQSEFGNYTIRAVHPERQIIEMNTLQKGRFLNNTDVNNKLKVAVIGKLVEKDLFYHENSIGKYINVNGINFKVVGTFADEGGDNEERIIYTPISTQQQLKGSTQNIDEIIIGYNPDKGADFAILKGEELKKKFRKHLQIHPDDTKGIFVRNSAEEASAVFVFLFVLIFITGFIGFGTLAAGMMGIFNIMIYSVKERTKELGIRKAIGAPPRSILFLVLTESVLITFLSGIIGIVIGILFLKYLGNKLEDYFIYNPSVDTSLIFAALFFLVFSGFVAGLIPAYRASKIKPIEALREE